MAGMRWRQFWCSMQGVIVVTPMCTKERLPLSNCSTESANKDTAKCVTAPTTVLQKSQLNPNVSHLARLLSLVPTLPGWKIRKAEKQLHKCYLCL